MKKISTLAVLCAMVLVFAAGSAFAYSSYTNQTGKACTYCHVNPRGGSELTSAGQYFRDHGTLPPETPSAPSSLSATASSSSQINLRWTDNSSNETGFKVERASSSGGSFTQIASLGAGATTYSNTGLTASTTYYYRVRASNASGNSGYSNTASATTSAPTPTTPATPTGLSATAASTSQINLRWTDASSNETGFRVERSSSSSSGFTAIATLGAGVTTYSNTGLTASTTYYYRVCATNSAGSSGFSNTASATTSAPTPTTPTAPTGLSATAASSSQINLRWTDASSNETGFRVERASSSGGPFTQIASLGAGATTYSNTGLTASTTYYYRVCATNAAGSSGFSNTASATTSAPAPTTPAAPTGLSATAASSSQINLRWTDASSNETGFRVERASSSGGPFSAIATVAAGVTTYSNTGLTASTTYYYRVCATNSAGSSGFSNTASATTSAPAPTTPAAPTGLSATAASSSQINLRWTDASSNETGFKVERSTSATGTFTAIATVAAGVATYSNTGLTASTTYFYRVCAVNAAGNSAFSNTASAATTAGQTTAGQYIRTWLLNGYYANSNNLTRLSTDYLGGEPNVVPSEGSSSGGKVWNKHDSTTNLINLASVFGNPSSCAGYAHVYVYSPTAKAAQLWLGSDNGIKVWVNGSNIWTADSGRGYTADQDKVQINLNAGWNKILVKVSQYGGNWCFSAKICDASGNAISGITYALNPPTASGAPVISDLTITAAGSTARIEWDTDKPCDTVVDFGTSTSLGRNISSSALVTHHVVNLSGLTDGTTYYAKVESTDSSGNSTSDGTHTFKTAGGNFTSLSYIRTWLLNGYYSNTNNSTRLSTDYLRGEAGVVPEEGKVSGTKTWTKYSFPNGFINLAQIAGNPTQCAGYASVYVYSPKAQRVNLWLGSDNGIKVWLNGANIWTVDSGRGYTADQDKLTMNLNAGWNKLLVKVSQYGGNWCFSARICDSSGFVIPGVGYSISP